MKEKKQKVFKGMTAPVDVHLDIPEDEIWTYKIDGLAEPHINKPFTNFTLKKIIFTVLILIAVGLSMYFSVRVVSRAEPLLNSLTRAEIVVVSPLSVTGILLDANR